MYDIKMLIFLLLILIIPLYYLLVNKAQRVKIKNTQVTNKYSDAISSPIIFLLKVKEMLPLPAST